MLTVTFIYKKKKEARRVEMNVRPKIQASLLTPHPSGGGLLTQYEVGNETRRQQRRQLVMPNCACMSSSARGAGVKLKIPLHLSYLAVRDGGDLALFVVHPVEFKV